MKRAGVRYAAGVTVVVLFQLAPLAIPFVWATAWSASVKGILSALLALGIPELGIVIAAMLIGRKEVRRIWRIVKVVAKRCYKYASSSLSL
jgi:hypothetical protein